MSNETKVYQRKLPELVVKPSNDWPAWSSKCQVQLEAWKVWDHIVGPNAKEPAVPPLVLPQEVKQTDKDGKETIVVKPGNEAEHLAAKEVRAKWLDKDLEVKALIFMAVPSSDYQTVHPCRTAASAWETLRLTFGAVNAEKAIVVKRRINLAICKSGENVRKWCDKQRKRYVELTRMDPHKMTEKEFCETILDQQDRTDRNWATRVSMVTDTVKNYQAKYGVYPSSVLVIQWLKHEYWALNGGLKDTDEESEGDDVGVAALNANTANYPSASYNGNNKRPRSDSDDPYEQNRSGKRPNKGKRSDVCTNSYCKRTGHPTDECFSYGGPKQGQYPWWWRGPWNLHIHPSQRTASNNIRPPPQAESRNGVISAVPSRSLANRITTEPTTTADVHNTLSNDMSIDSRIYYPNDSVHNYSANHVDVEGGVNVFDEMPGVYTETGNPEAIKCNASALDTSKPALEDCIHDSGANRHVFHSRESFKEYQEIEPVKVNGFGKDLNTCAVGIGSVHVEAWRQGGTKTLFELTNCIHVPSARYNLISQAQLDKAGAQAVVGNSKITIHQKGLILLDGHLGSNLMYKLNMWPVPQTVDDDRKLEALVHAFTLDTMDDHLTVDKSKLKEDFTTASLGI